MKRIALLLLACLLSASAWASALAEDNPDVIFAQDISAISVVDYGSDTQLTDEYGTYYVSNCFDHNLNTCWAEGASGDGIGSVIWGRWRVNRGGWLLKGIAIWGGYHKSEDVYYKNNRPSGITVDIYCDGLKKTIDARLYDLPRCNLLFLDDYTAFDDETEVFVTLNSVYPGNKYQDTCITDIDLIVQGY